MATGAVKDIPEGYRLTAAKDIPEGYAQVPPVGDNWDYVLGGGNIRNILPFTQRYQYDTFINSMPDPKGFEDRFKAVGWMTSLEPTAPDAAWHGVESLAERWFGEQMKPSQIVSMANQHEGLRKSIQETWEVHPTADPEQVQKVRDLFSGKLPLPEEELKTVRRSVFNGLWKEQHDAAVRGGLQADHSLLGWSVSMGGMDPEQALEIHKEYQKRYAEDPIKGANWAQDIYLATVQMAPMLYKGGKRGAAIGSAAAGAWALSGGVAGPQALTVIDEIGAFGGGMTTGAMSYWAQIGAGEIYWEARDKGLSHETASYMASIGGPFYGAVEFSQVSKLVPGRQWVKKRIWKWMLNSAKTLGHEVAEEAIQRGIVGGAVSIGRQVEGQLTAEDIPAEALQLIKEMAVEAKQSVGPLALLSAPGMARGAIGTTRAAIVEGRQRTQVRAILNDPFIEPMAKVGLLRRAAAAGILTDKMVKELDEDVKAANDFIAAAEKAQEAEAVAAEAAGEEAPTAGVGEVAAQEATEGLEHPIAQSKTHQQLAEMDEHEYANTIHMPAVERLTEVNEQMETLREAGGEYTQTEEWSALSQERSQLQEITGVGNRGGITQLPQAGQAYHAQQAKRMAAGVGEVAAQEATEGLGEAVAAEGAEGVEDWQLSKREYNEKYTHREEAQARITKRLQYNPARENPEVTGNDIESVLRKRGFDIINIRDLTETNPDAFAVLIRQGAVTEIQYKNDKGEEKWAYVLNVQQDIDWGTEESFISNEELSNADINKEFRRRRAEYRKAIKTETGRVPQNYFAMIRDAIEKGKPVSSDKYIDLFTTLGARQTLESIEKGMDKGFQPDQKTISKIESLIDAYETEKDVYGNAVEPARNILKQSSSKTPAATQAKPSVKQAFDQAAAEGKITRALAKKAQEYQDVADQVGADIQEWDFKVDDHVIDYENDDDLEILRKNGFSEKDIENAKAAGKTYYIGGIESQHRDNRGRPAGSKIEIFPRGDATDVFEEIIHAGQRAKGQVETVSRAKREGRAKSMAARLAKGEKFDARQALEQEYEDFLEDQTDSELQHSIREEQASVTAEESFGRIPRRTAKRIKSKTEAITQKFVQRIDDAIALRDEARVFIQKSLPTSKQKETALAQLAKITAKSWTKTNLKTLEGVIAYVHGAAERIRKEQAIAAFPEELQKMKKKFGTRESPFGRMRPEFQERAEKIADAIDIARLSPGKKADLRGLQAQIQKLAGLVVDLNTDWMAVDPDLGDEGVREFLQIPQKRVKELARLGTKPLAEMEAVEIEAVIEELHRLVRMNALKNKLLLGKRAEQAAAMLEAVTGEILPAGDARIEGAFKDFAFNKGNTPATIVNLVSGGLDTAMADVLVWDIYEGLDRAADMQHRISVEVQNRLEKAGITRKVRQAWAKAEHTFPGIRDQNGNPITLSEEALVSVLMDLRNPDNLNAAMKGYKWTKSGILGRLTKKDIIATGPLTLEQLGELVSPLKDKHRMAADIANHVQDEMTKPELNKTSVGIYGYNMFNVNRYWRLNRVRPLSLAGTKLSESEIMPLSSRGFTQMRVGGQDPIWLVPFWDKLYNSVQESSAWAHLMEPIYNAKSVMATRQWQNAMEAAGRTTQMKQLLEGLGRLERGVTAADAVAQWASFITRGYGRYVLGLNFGSIFAQLASYPMMASVDPGRALKYLPALAGEIATFGLGTKELKAEMEQHSGLAWKRHAALQFSRDIGDINAVNASDGFFFGHVPLLNKPMLLQQRTDRMVIEVAWLMAKDYVNDTTKLKGEAYWSAVRKRFQRLVMTQPNWEPYMRSEFLTATSFVGKQLFIFRSPIEAMWNELVRAGADAKNGKGTAHLAATIPAILTSLIAFRLIKNAWKAILKKLGDDEEEEKRDISTIETLAYDLVNLLPTAPLTTPIVKELGREIARGVDPEQAKETRRWVEPWIEQMPISDLAAGPHQLVKDIGAALRATSTGHRDADEKQTKAAETAIKVVGMYLGLPIATPLRVYREVSE